MKLLNGFSRFIKNIFKRFTPDGQTSRFVIGLMEGLKATRDVELSCDEVFELIDQYTELIARGEDAAILMPLIEHHLEMCPECEEEYEALLRIIEASPLYT